MRIDARTAAIIGGVMLAYAVWTWLTYVAKYRRDRVDTIARLIYNGAKARRETMIQQEHTE